MMRCSNFAFNCNLRHYSVAGGFSAPPPTGAFAFEMPQLCSAAKGKESDPLPDALEREARGLHSSTFRLNLSRFCPRTPPMYSL